VTTSTWAPFFLPTSARASGEVMEILALLGVLPDRRRSATPPSCRCIVDQGDGGAEGDGVAGKASTRRDLGRRKLVLELGVRPSLRDAYSLAVIFGVIPKDRRACEPVVICWMMRGRSPAGRDCDWLRVPNSPPLCHRDFRHSVGQTSKQTREQRPKIIQVAGRNAISGHATRENTGLLHVPPCGPPES